MLSDIIEPIRSIVCSKKRTISLARRRRVSGRPFFTSIDLDGRGKRAILMMLVGTAEFFSSPASRCDTSES